MPARAETIRCMTSLPLRLCISWRHSFWTRSPASSGVTDQAAGFVADLSAESLDEVAHTRRGEAHAVTVAMKPEMRLDAASEFAVIEPLLDDLGRLAVTRQPLAGPVAQHDDATNGEFISSPLVDGEDETAVAESGLHDLAQQSASRSRPSNDVWPTVTMKTADVPTGGAIVE